MQYSAVIGGQQTSRAGRLAGGHWGISDHSAHHPIHDPANPGLGSTTRVPGSVSAQRSIISA
jgi:hypothetical protein